MAIKINGITVIDDSRAGNLASAEASGNITGGNIITTGLVTATGNIAGGNLSGTSIVGTLTTAAQTNITSVGTLTALTVTGNVTGGNLVINNNAVITGNLTVQGTETIFNVETLTVNDKDIVVANNVTGGANVNGAGLLAGNPTVASWLFNNATTSWQSNVAITPSANATLDFGGASNRWRDGYFTTVAATGNITGGNLITAGLVSLSSITKTGSNGVGNIGAAASSFDTIFAKATSAQYADLAEMYEADAVYEPGTVLCFGGSREVTLCDSADCARVAGVVSTNPSYLMNSGQPGEHVVPVALIGRVPTLVQGSVRKGDLMVSTAQGRACANNSARVGTVIGKALEDFDGTTGMIEVVVGRV